jgi:hypothetical protein
MEVVWDQFKEAFRGHYVPVGLMAIKHIEFVNTEVKKIASFKRGLCPKLMKAMCNSKCATFNEFVCDTIL